MLQLLYRPAESDGKFMPFATAATLAEARDELASPVGVNPHHGDLARVVGDGVDDLYVFDGARSSFVEVPRRTGEESWFERWEGNEADARAMLRACRNVDRRRLVLAACDCAETKLRYVPSGEDRPRIAIETARGWVRGEATTKEVRAAADAALDAAVRASYDAFISITTAASAAAVVTNSSPSSGASGVLSPFGTNTRKSVAPLVRRHIPLSVLACSIVGAVDPMPMQFELLRDLDVPRKGNPGGRLPASAERCVAKVGPKRVEQLGARDGLSSAIAICTAQGQRSGTLRVGTRTPTAKGMREERNARRRKGFVEAEREVARLAEMARKDNMHHNNGRRARKSNGAMVRYQVWERRAGSRAARPWRLAISDTTSNDAMRHLHDLVDRRPMVEMVAIEGVASHGFARADLPEGRVLARVRTDAHGVVPMQSPQTKRVGGTLRFVSRYSPREWQELAAQSDTPLAVSDFASGWVELGMDLPEASLFLARGISNPREALRLRGSVGKTRTKTR